jgi:protein-disulfide isomerase-like protein with CxxC motif
MHTPTLHYIFDPLCGWCYGAAPLVQAARALAGIDVAFHAGGILTGSNRRQITPQWRNYVLPHDRRIAAAPQPRAAAGAAMHCDADSCIIES